MTEMCKAMKEWTGWARSTTKTPIACMTGNGYLRFDEGVKAI